MMRVISTLRYVTAGSALIGVGSFALAAAPPVVEGQESFLQDGKAGFVVSQIEYAMSHDAGETGACPNGMSLSMREQLALTPEGRERLAKLSPQQGQQAGQNSAAPQYRIRAIPAFVVDSATRSLNEDLVRPQ